MQELTQLGAEGPPQASVGLSYTPGGNLEVLRDLTDPAEPEIASYDYDDLDRLTEETTAEGQNTFGYDDAGALVHRTTDEITTRYHTTHAGQLAARTTEGAPQAAAYFYDPRGHLERIVSEDGATEVSFDAEGLLSRVAPPKGPEVALSYDALGQRVQKLVGEDATAYTWEKGRLVGVSGATEASFAYDAEGTPLSITVGEQTYIYRTDHRGSVTSLTEAATGAEAAGYEYDAWGAITAAQGDQGLLGANPFTYLGAHAVLHDAETGTYQMGERTYDPATGRFLSPDPAEDDPTESPYAYAGANPTTLMDPTGLFAEGARWRNFRPVRPRPKVVPKPRPAPQPVYRSRFQARRTQVARRKVGTALRTPGFMQKAMSRRGNLGKSARFAWNGMKGAALRVGRCVGHPFRCANNIGGKVWNGAGAVIGEVSRLGGAKRTRCYYSNVRCYRNVGWLKYGRANGMAIGRTVFCRRRCNRSLLRHEVEHVRQFQKYKGTFPFRWGWEAIRRGRGCRNKYERPAYQRQGLCR